MKRRFLLIALSGPSLLLAAGCTSNDTGRSNASASDTSDTSTQSCGVAITEASVSVEYHCDTGEARTGHIEGRAQNCNTDLTLEILDDGEIVDEVTFEPTETRFSVGFGEGPGQLRSIPSRGDKHVRIRSPDAEVHAESTLAVSHYLDSPSLDVWRPQFEPETVSVGEPVTVTFSVATFGAGTSFTASLLIDDETIETRDGTVDEGTDCQTASGPEYEFIHTFNESGTYELTGRITIDGSSQGGDIESIGTVTVTG